MFFSTSQEPAVTTINVQEGKHSKRRKGRPKRIGVIARGQKRIVRSFVDVVNLMMIRRRRRHLMVIQYNNLFSKIWIETDVLFYSQIVKFAYGNIFYGISITAYHPFFAIQGLKRKISPFQRALKTFAQEQFLETSFWGTWGYWFRKKKQINILLGRLLSHK